MFGGFFDIYIRRQKMWKKWETVTEAERTKITEIADTYDVPRRDVASMFQSGMDFDEITKKLNNQKRSTN